MALRDQPYLPLYIQDIMTDEKLNECSASTHGIFIKGIMCLMHKSEAYGKILLKQKHKQTESKEKNFAYLLAKHLPYTEEEIYEALCELITEGVCHFEDDYLVQKRMVRDNFISETRAKAGKSGGEKTQKSNKDFAKAKSEANSEYENEDKSENKDDNIKENKDEKPENFFEEKGIAPMMVKVFQSIHPNYPKDQEKDFSSCLEIAYKIGEGNGWTKNQVLDEKRMETVKFWEQIVHFSAADKWFSTRSISDLNKEWQRLIQTINNARTPTNGKQNSAVNGQQLNEAHFKRFGNR